MLLDIVEVHFHLLVEGDFRTTRDLPDAGDAGLHVEPLERAWLQRYGRG